MPKMKILILHYSLASVRWNFDLAIVYGRQIEQINMKLRLESESNIWQSSVGNRLHWTNKYATEIRKWK